ncbi:hypothetical protein U1Q18_038135 [Sarracenia purpurea var. burkii]
MGCSPSTSMYALGRKKETLNIYEIAIFVPSMRVPVQSDLQRALRGLIPKDLVDRVVSLRNQIVLVAEDTDAGGSAVPELQRALEDYLPLLLGLTRKEHGLQEVAEFKWKNLQDGRQEICVANSWFEILSVIHTMAILTLAEANSIVIPKYHSGSSERLVYADCMRDAVDLLLKASGYLDFCVRHVLVRLPPYIKNKLPKDLQGSVLEAVSIQALGQGTEMQLGLAVESQNATLAVKRRLACEQIRYYGQTHYCLSGCNTDDGYAKKQLFFIKWKYLESKAAAYFYHGLILDKGTEPSSHVSALCCFLAAEELLSESKKACLTFCLAVPVTRVPPPWGAMKHLNRKIPEVACKKSQMHGNLLDQEKIPAVTKT